MPGWCLIFTAEVYDCLYIIHDMSHKSSAKAKYSARVNLICKLLNTFSNMQYLSVIF